MLSRKRAENVRPSGTGGEGGIRTHGRLAPTAVFKTAALNHSATSPGGIQLRKGHTLCKLCDPGAACLRKASKFQCGVHHSGRPLIGWAAAPRYLNECRVKARDRGARYGRGCAYHGDVSA